MTLAMSPPGELFPKIGLVVQHSGRAIHLQVFQNPGELPEVAKAIIAFTALTTLDPMVNSLLS